MVFISYSSKDSAFAYELKSMIESNGIECWMAPGSIPPGGSYAVEIPKAIKACNAFVLLLSENSQKSKWVPKEVDTALSYEKIVIPFHVDASDINEQFNFRLTDVQRVEAFNRRSEAYKEILNWLKTINNPSSSVPANARITKSVRPNVVSNCRMASFEELLTLGYTASSIAEKLVANDAITCGDVGMENEGTAEQWEEYLQNNNDTFHYLLNAQNEIVGDWSIVALNDEAFDKAQKGQMLEKDFDYNITELICLPGIYNGYILAFSLLPQYRSVRNYNLIIDSFFKQLEAFSENGIYFRKWIINVFGKEIEALVRQMGFRFVCNNIVCGKIYQMDFIPLPGNKMIAQYPRLIENYKNA